MLIPLSPPPGLNSDDTTFSAEGRWADGDNVRFRNGKPESIGGRGVQFTAANGKVYGIYPFTRAGSVCIAYGTGRQSANLYVGSASAYPLTSPTNRTPAWALTGSDVDGWALASWGDTLLAAPFSTTTAVTGLYAQSGTSTAAIIATAPAKMNYMLVTAERQVLALGCNEEVSTTFNAMCIRGSDLEDYTNWTTSATNNAFEHILEGSGRIIAGRVIGSYVAVWTDSALYLGQFIGDPSQAYRFDKIADNCGLIGPNAVVVHNGAAYWMGPDQSIRVWSPGALPQLIPCPVRKHFTDEVMLIYTKHIVASVTAKFGEVRFDYETALGACHYMAFNAADGTWYRGTTGDTARVDAEILTAATSAAADMPTIVGADVNNRIVLEEAGAGTGNLVSYIQAADQYVDEGRRRVMIRRCFPDAVRSGTLTMTIYVRDYPTQVATTKGPYTITSTTNKVDFRASGKIVAVRIDSVGIPFRLGKFEFDVVNLGER